MSPSFLQYLVLCIAFFLFVQLFDKHLTGISTLLLFWSVIEAVWGILQACGYGGVSHHMHYIIIGSFGNPGPYGALIAVGMTLAATIAWRQYHKFDPSRKALYYLSLATLLLGFVVLPASRSRAAWIGLTIAIIVLLFHEANLSIIIRRQRLAAVGFTVLLLFVGVGVFLMKKDSAIGRFHIWNMESRVIAEHPWTGVGLGKIYKAYGDEQSLFFQYAERPAAIVRVAGSPTHAYNEYLKYGMAWGIGGLFLAVSVAVFVIWRLFRKNSPLAYCAIVYAVFAFASFPLSVVQLKVLGTILLAAALEPEKAGHSWILWLVVGFLCCVCTVAGIKVYPQEKARRSAEKVWKSSPYLKQEVYDLSVSRLQSLYPRLKDNYKYLYDYGYSLHKTGEYEESNRILQQGADISCDPIFHTIIAKNYIALQQFDEAEAELLKAHWLIPCRIYPLWILMRLYADLGKEADAINMGRIIKDMPVYKRNPNMAALYSEAMGLLNQLEMRR